ncbi:MAG TPA: hypothetical protein VGJ00_05845 [Rhabdochlamydiaceae bacterium]|jgi:hypothetical protein
MSTLITGSSSIRSVDAGLSRENTQFVSQVIPTAQQAIQNSKPKPSSSSLLQKAWNWFTDETYIDTATKVAFIVGMLISIGLLLAPFFGAPGAEYFSMASNMSFVLTGVVVVVCLTTQDNFRELAGKMIQKLEEAFERFEHILEVRKVKNLEEHLKKDPEIPKKFLDSLYYFNHYMDAQEKEQYRNCLAAQGKLNLEQELEENGKAELGQGYLIIAESQ